MDVVRSLREKESISIQAEEMRDDAVAQSSQ